MSLKKLGRYDIVKPLGKGAMGLVYEAHDPNLDRRVAIKTIRVDQLSEDMAAEYESRFRAEARAGGRLQHPNIIGVYDAGRDEGMAFMVMELIRGGDLKQQLDQGTRLTFDRSFAIMRELLSALSFAHEQGIIHRDIKPANVMLDSNGKVKLGDFGVARITSAGDMTRTQGSMVGTLKYMSPEQVQGLQVDFRTDLFAAGVVMYQLLTGSKPFEGPNDFAIMQAIASRDPAPPSHLNPSLPEGIDAVLAKALAKDRDQRFASARDFMVALRTVVAQAARSNGGLANLAPAPTPTAPVPPAVAPTSQGGASATGNETLPGIAGTNTRGPTLGTSASTVSQEMELLYWKDIQESSDPEDFQGFLEQFPSGVYAGLAARRLRKLARALGDATGSQSVISLSPFGMPVDPAAPPTSPGSSPSTSSTDSPALASDDSGSARGAETERVAAERAAEELAATERAAEELAATERAAEELAAAERAAAAAAAEEEARRVAEEAHRAARAAEEEARWQEALRQEALRKEQVRLAEEARSEAARLEEARIEEARITDAKAAEERRQAEAARAAREELRARAAEEAQRLKAQREVEARQHAAEEQAAGERDAQAAAAAEAAQAQRSARDEEDRLAAEAQRAAELRWLGPQVAAASPPSEATAGPGPEHGPEAGVEDETTRIQPALKSASPPFESGMKQSPEPGAVRPPERSAKANLGAPLLALAAVAAIALAAGLIWWAMKSSGESAPAPAPFAPASGATSAVATSASASASASTSASAAPPASAPLPALSTASAAAGSAAVTPAASEAKESTPSALLPAKSPADAVVQIETAADPSISISARAGSSTLVAGRDVLRLTLNSNEAGFVYVLGYAADGSVLELLQPNGIDGRTRITADAPLDLRLNRRNNLVIPGSWHLLVIVARQARDLAAAGWRRQGAGTSRAFSTDEPTQASAWPGPVCLPGTEPCADGYGTQEVELIVLPPPPPVAKEPDRPASFASPSYTAPPRASANETPAAAPANPPTKAPTKAECDQARRRLAAGDGSPDLMDLARVCH